jgi:hypothetical protein
LLLLLDSARGAAALRAGGEGDEFDWRDTGLSLPRVFGVLYRGAAGRSGEP